MYAAVQLQICTKTLSGYTFSPDSKAIEERKNAISQLWTSLKETIDMRSMALAVAREIHTFDRDVGDIKERIQVYTPTQTSV